MLAMINKCVTEMTTCYCIATKISKLLWDKAEKVRNELFVEGGGSKRPTRSDNSCSEVNMTR